MDKVSEKLAREMGCEEPDVIPSILVLEVFSCIKAGSPTMTQIGYTEDGMVPLMRGDCSSENWKAKKVILRCRWDDSPVLVEYKDFLRSCQEASSRTHSSQPPSAPGPVSLKRPRSIMDDVRGSRPSQQPRFEDTAHAIRRLGPSQIGSPLPPRPLPAPAPYSPMPYDTSHQFNLRSNSGPRPLSPPFHLTSLPNQGHLLARSNSSRGRFNTPPPPIHGNYFDRYDHFSANRTAYPGGPGHFRLPHTPSGPQTSLENSRHSSVPEGTKMEQNRPIVPRVLR